MSRPAALRQGDGVAVVAPSSPFDRDRFERGVRALQEMGFEPRFGEGIYARHAGYLAGPDARRLDELVRALRDPSARAIVLARGGYGLLRIAGGIPRELVTKPVVGYSDATVLHEIWSRAGIPSVHGPMCTQLGEEETAVARLRTLLYGGIPEPLRWSARSVRPGRVEAPLRGGNLAVLASLCGTPLQPSFRGAIVLLEDLNEPAYRLDRLCTQLLLAGAFAGAAAFVVGDLSAAGEENEGRDDAVAERLSTLGVPVLLGAPFGHGDRNQPVALGVGHALDTEQGSLTQLEPMLEKSAAS
ncbi:MAG TPA: LD-carboxypeptidase [Myxococcales bacterium]|nr:LD-carboxypeptidase [Myxococcales bacterium]